MSAKEQSKKRVAKSYLGDAVYADFDGYHIVLTTTLWDEGPSINKIFLEPDVMQNLILFNEKIEELRKAVEDGYSL